MTFCGWSKSHECFGDLSYPREIVTLGDHIRKKRLDLGLLQQDLAVTLGVHHKTIPNWELGNTEPQNPVLYSKIIGWLGYNPFPEPKNFGERLWQIRMIMGITAEEASKEIGVDQSTFGRWETNKKEPWGECKSKLDHWLSVCLGNSNHAPRTVPPPLPSSRS